MISNLKVSSKLKSIYLRVIKEAFEKVKLLELKSSTQLISNKEIEVKVESINKNMLTTTEAD